jgi:hypothetical protein
MQHLASVKSRRLQATDTYDTLLIGAAVLRSDIQENKD